jgi:signal transduction histidine kinase
MIFQGGELMGDREPTRQELLDELSALRARVEELERAQRDGGWSTAAAQDHLLQADRMDAVGRLAGGIAHEFNNLLTVILGYTDLGLFELPENDPVRSNFEEIKKAGIRVAMLTRQLLAFGRKQVLEAMVLNVNALLTAMHDQLIRLAGPAIELDLRLDPAVESVQVDPAQLGEVVVHLVANARGAMPDGGRVRIETGNVEIPPPLDPTSHGPPPGEYVCMSVSDTGCGMDKDTCAHVFDPFFTTKEVGEGTGLGLAMVYGIVKQSDGHLTVESEPGRGTTFRIYLPQYG